MRRKPLRLSSHRENATQGLVTRMRAPVGSDPAPRDREPDTRLDYMYRFHDLLLALADAVRFGES